MRSKQHKINAVAKVATACVGGLEIFFEFRNAKGFYFHLNMLKQLGFSSKPGNNCIIVLHQGYIWITCEGIRVFGYCGYE